MADEKLGSVEGNEAKRRSLEQIAFPTLTEEQIDILDDLAACKTYQKGEILFSAGDQNFKFYIVRSGSVEVVERSSGEERRVALHTVGEFTGDVDMLTGKPSLVTALAHETTDVYEIPCTDIQKIISEVPTLGEQLLRAFMARRELLIDSEFEGLNVLGHDYSSDAHRIREFLSKNQVPFTWTDLDEEEDVVEFFRTFGIGEADLPVVIHEDERIFRKPPISRLAESLGIRQAPEDICYDLVVIGAGPAGLAAAVYGASEGLKTIVLEQIGPGGQAGSSSKIENYLGFPTGLSGAELAERATLQAQKFGARISAPSVVTGFRSGDGCHFIELEGGELVQAGTVLIATGAAYRKLDAEGREKFDGAGVYYAATATEAQICAGCPVFVVGGGNSAGQAAIYLSEHAASVELMIRSGDLRRDMSSYLADRIESTPNITVRLSEEIVKMEGDDHLQAVYLRPAVTAEESDSAATERRTMAEPERIETSAVFTFIGAEPCTAWLPEEIETDRDGFIITGRPARRSEHWNLERPPYLLETSSPGIFAAGDVRRGSIKRVASAVGEGSMAVKFVHEYRAEMSGGDDDEFFAH